MNYLYLQIQGRIIRPVLYLKIDKDYNKYNEFILGNYEKLENWSKCDSWLYL